MRYAILNLSLALALAVSVMPTTARADGNGCTQLRALVFNSIPLISRGLPYDSLDCGAIGEIYLLSTNNRDLNGFRLNQRLEAVFRREGLIR